MNGIIFPAVEMEEEGPQFALKGLKHANHADGSIDPHSPAAAIGGGSDGNGESPDLTADPQSFEGMSEEEKEDLMEKASMIYA